MRDVVFAHRFNRWNKRKFQLIGPTHTVRTEGLAVGVANEGGTIDDFDGTFSGGGEILHFRQKSKPAPESLTVAWIIKAEEIGRAVESRVNSRRGRAERCDNREDG